MREDLIIGRRAIAEAMAADRAIDKIYIAKGDRDGNLGKLSSEARERGIAVVMTDRRALDTMTENAAHQGIAAVAAERAYSGISDILASAEARGEPPLIVMCDGISDGHNLGAIIRTAECAGAHGIIIPRRRSAGLTAAVGKAAAGAIEHIPVARVPNLPAAMRELKDAGVWVYGADAQGGNPLWSSDLKGPVCLVIGSEGKGLGRLVREHCDGIVTIPMYGKIASLNASASAAILLYEVARQNRRGE